MFLLIKVMFWKMIDAIDWALNFARITEDIEEEITEKDRLRVEYRRMLEGKDEYVSKAVVDKLIRGWFYYEILIMFLLGILALTMKWKGML